MFNVCLCFERAFFFKEKKRVRKVFQATTKVSIECNLKSKTVAFGISKK